MTKPTAGVALLLVGVVAVAGHVTCLPTVVAQLLSLLLRLLAVSGDVTSFATVITGCRDDRVLNHHLMQLLTYNKYYNPFTTNSDSTLRPELKSS